MVCRRKERGETSSASVCKKHPVPVSPLPGCAPGRSREAGTSGIRAGAFRCLPSHSRASPASLGGFSQLGQEESHIGKGRGNGCPSQNVTAPQSREKEGRAPLGTTLLPLPWWRTEALRGNACSPYRLWGGSQIHPLSFQSPPDALGLPRHH